MRRWLGIGVLLMGVGSVWSKGPAGGSHDVGLLIMAHGGDAQWNRAVKDAVAPLEEVCPVVVAYGMAQREPLRKGILRLEAQGVQKIAVVRLFVDGRSFLSQTEYLLGVRVEPPPFFLHHDSEHHHQAMSRDAVRLLRGAEIPPPIEVESQVVLSAAGLLDSRLAGGVLLDRVRALSESPAAESVLVIGHGVESDDRDRYWKERMEKLTQGLKVLGRFRAVRVETLREDWEAKRRMAEERIRDFVSKQSRQGRVLVVPFRVFGFGPYGKVLEGLDYRAEGKGLLPHRNVTRWLQEQARDCFLRAGWSSPFPFDSLFPPPGFRVRRRKDALSLAVDPMAVTILSILLVVAILGGCALLTQLFARVMYRRCPECGILNARRRLRCRQCGFLLVEAHADRR